jgi:hypothetical protein
VLGDGLLGDVDLLGDLTHRARAGPHQPHDRLPAWLRQCLQDRFRPHLQVSTCESHRLSTLRLELSHEKETSMPAFLRTIDVAADPDVACRVLGDLGAVDRWIPGITKVELNGMTRVCSFADGRTQHEEVLDYSLATRSYRYTIDGGLPVTNNRGASPLSRPRAAHGSSGSPASRPSTRAPRPSLAGCGKGCCRPCSATSRASSSSADPGQEPALDLANTVAVVNGVDRDLLAPAGAFHRWATAEGTAARLAPADVAGPGGPTPDASAPGRHPASAGRQRGTPHSAPRPRSRS